MDLHDAFAGLVDDVSGVDMADLRELRRQARWRRVAVGTSVTVALAVAGVAGALQRSDQRQVVRTGPPRTSALPIPQPPPPTCELPETQAQLRRVVAPADVVARASVGKQVVIDEVLAGTAKQGVIAVAVEPSLLPSGDYVLVLSPALDAYNVEGGRAGIFQLAADGSLGQLCNNYPDPSHPLHASGSLDLTQLRSLLARLIGRTVVSGSLSRVGGPYPGTAVPTDGTVRIESETETALIYVQNGTGRWSTAVKPGTYTVTATGSGVTCGSRQLTVGTTPVTGLDLVCPVP